MSHPSDPDVIDTCQDQDSSQDPRGYRKEGHVKHVTAMGTPCHRLVLIDGFLDDRFSTLQTVHLITLKYLEQLRWLFFGPATRIRALEPLGLVTELISTGYI